MAKLIFTCEYIKKGKAGGYVKYIATRDGVVVPRLENHVGYIANRPNSHGLFTSSEDTIQLAKVAREVDAHGGNVWTNVISLRREDAVRLGYDNPESWRTLLRSHAQTFAEQMKVPLEDLRWYAAFHDEGHHPHCHMVAYSVGKQPYLSKAGINSIRSALARDIFKQDLLQIYQKQTEHRNALTSKGREVISDIIRQIDGGEYSNPAVEDLLMKLSDRLANHRGKKVYGYLDQPGRQLVNAIVDELGKDERIAGLYDLWYEQRENVLATYRSSMPERIPLSQNSEFKAIKNEILKQLTMDNGHLQLTVDNGELTIKRQGQGQNPVEAIFAVARYDDLPTEELTEEFDPDDYFADWNDAYKLARAYLYGSDLVEQNFDDAFALMLVEAERGNAFALFDVGRMCRDGLGCEQDEEKAHEWFAKAYTAFLVAEVDWKHNAYIQHRLGKMHAQGFGVEQSYESAAGWYEKAVEQRNLFAAYALGKQYYLGQGVEQDFHRAFELYKMAANSQRNPNAFAMYELGQMFCDGVGTEVDEIASAMWFARAFGRFVSLERRTKDDKLQYRLGQMCMNGVGTEMDLQSAHDYFEKAAKMGNLNAIYGLGKVYLDENFAGHNPAKAAEWLEKAAEQNHMWAQFRLGVMLLYGKGVEQDTERGLQLLTASADQGNEIATAVMDSYREFVERVRENARANAKHHAAVASLNLLRNLAGLIQNRLDEGHQDGIVVDSKLRREIAEKKRGLGLR